MQHIEKKIVLTDKQKKYLWDYLDMDEIYADMLDYQFANFETAKNGEWRLDYNGDEDYPWSLFVVIGYWDDLGHELVHKILTEV